MRRVARQWFVGVVVLGLAGVGCTDHGESVRAAPSTTVQLSPVGEPGMDVSPFPISRGVATAAGTDLVVISSNFQDARPLEAALRREDGSWWALPPLPFTGFIELASAGDRAIAGGIACVDDDCVDGEVAFAMLNDDHTAWERIDVPHVALTVADTELSSDAGPAPLAGFAIGPSAYWIDARGALVDWRPQPLPGAPLGARQFGCFSDKSYTSMQIDIIETNEAVRIGHAQEMLGDVYVQPIDGSTPPVPVAAVPPGTVSSFAYFCAVQHIIIEHAGTESVFHIDSRTWETAPSNFSEVTDGQVNPISGSLAIAPDGSTVFLASTDQIARRSGLGVWEPTGVTGAVFATDAQVLAFSEGQTVTVLWPPT